MVSWSRVDSCSSASTVTPRRSANRSRVVIAVSIAYYLGCGGKAPPHHGETWVSNPADAGGLTTPPGTPGRPAGADCRRDLRDHRTRSDGQYATALRPVGDVALHHRRP